MKRISIIGSAGIPAKYGGFETLAENLVKHLSSKYEITVFCSSKLYDEKRKTYLGANLCYLNFKPNGFQSIIYDVLSILKSIKFADIILCLGVSGAIIFPFIRLFSKKKIVVNIDGLEWKRDKWNMQTKFFLKFCENLSVRFSDAVIADNRCIEEYVSQTYNKKSILIEYGGDQAKRIDFTRDTKLRYPFLVDERYAFSVCRIEPENNLHIILEAFSKYSELNIVIVGNWSSSKYGLNLKSKYGNGKYHNIFLLEPIYEINTLNQLRSNCYLYIHGHSAGGTNPSLVEAMFSGVPILAYDVCYNRETTKYKALYFTSSEDIIQTLSNIDDNKLIQLANDLLLVAKKRYTWETIVAKYSELFENLG